MVFWHFCLYTFVYTGYFGLYHIAKIMGKKPSSADEKAKIANSKWNDKEKLDADGLVIPGEKRASLNSPPVIRNTWYFQLNFEDYFTLMYNCNDKMLGVNSSHCILATLAETKVTERMW